jgi:hypothetical protein
MTNNEFKAWFEGFSESIERTPTAKQWEKITAKVKLIDGAVSYPYVVYRDRYVDRYPVWPYGNVMTTNASMTKGLSAGAATSAMGADAQLNNTQNMGEFLRNMGRAEAAES